MQLLTAQSGDYDGIRSIVFHQPNVLVSGALHAGMKWSLSRWLKNERQKIGRNIYIHTHTRTHTNPPDSSFLLLWNDNVLYYLALFPILFLHDFNTNVMVSSRSAGQEVKQTQKRLS